MLRRFLIVLCLVPLILSVLVFPAFAASYSYTLTFVPGEGFVSFDVLIPSSGTCNYSITLLDPESGLSFSSSGVGVITNISPDLDITYSALNFSFDEFDNFFELIFIELDGDSAVGIMNTNDISFSSYVWYITISTYEVPAFEESTNNGLVTGISWIKSVIDSLISGDLVNLLSIGAISISISLLLLAAKIVRKLSWGS